MNEWRNLFENQEFHKGFILDKFEEWLNEHYVRDVQTSVVHRQIQLLKQSKVAPSVWKEFVTHMDACYSKELQTMAKNHKGDEMDEWYNLFENQEYMELFDSHKDFILDKFEEWLNEHYIRDAQPSVVRKQIQLLEQSEVAPPVWEEFVTYMDACYSEELQAMATEYERDIELTTKEMINGRA